MYAFPNDGVVSIRWCSASVDYKTIQRAIKWDSFSLNDFFPLDVIGVKRYRYPMSCATDPLPLREIGIPRDFLSPAPDWLFRAKTTSFVGIDVGSFNTPQNPENP